MKDTVKKNLISPAKGHSTALGDAVNIVILLNAMVYLAALVAQEKGWVNMF